MAENHDRGHPVTSEDLKEIVVNLERKMDDNHRQLRGEISSLISRIRGIEEKFESGMFVSEDFNRVSVLQAEPSLNSITDYDWKVYPDFGPTSITVKD